MKADKKWADLDLAPLPFESLESAVLRFAWSNGLSWKEIKVHVGAPGHRLRPDCERLEAATGWFMQMRSECVGDLATVKGRFADPWRVKLFRFCPICTEGLFHSFLYQYVDVHTCPIHGAELLTRCVMCGADSPAVRTLYQTPLRCTHCEQYLCGASPTLAEHFSLRGDRDYLERRLKQLHRWTVSGQVRQQEASFIMRTAVRSMNAQLARRNADIARELARATHTAAAMKSFSLISERICLDGYICLRWNYRVAIHVAVRPNSGAAAIKTVEAVYQSLLRTIERWLLSEGSDAVLRRAGCRTYYPLPPEHWDHAWQAYRLFRSHLEYQLEGINRRPFVHYANARLIGLPELQVAAFCGRPPRLGWRAALLACYAHWYHFVSAPVNWIRLADSMPERGHLLLSSTCELDFGRDSIYRFTDRGGPDSPRRYRGCIWMRRIPGWPFYPAAEEENGAPA